VNVLGFWIFGKSTKVALNFDQDRNRAVDDVGVAYEPVVVRVRGDVGELVRVGSQIEELADAKRVNGSPRPPSCPAALLHEHDLPVVVAHAQRVAVVGDINERLRGDFSALPVRNSTRLTPSMWFL
jgi:hypothetical protein